MEFDLIPIDEIMYVLRAEPDNKLAFKKIIAYANEKMSSLIWTEYDRLNIERDAKEACKWLQEQIDKYPDSTGIYFGLDSLNMNEGNGTNVEIGLSKSCDPLVFPVDWVYECEDYGNSHLIKGLYEVSDSFHDDTKWTSDEQRIAEYVISLGYSGIVLREALNNLKTENEFLAIWSFHDGDLYYLMQQTKKMRAIITEIDL